MSESRRKFTVEVVSVVVTCLMFYLVITHISSHIASEIFNSSEYDTWIQLAHMNIVEGSETVMNLNDTITYTKGIDYEMDYMNGRIKVLSTGSMSNWTEYSISYIYRGGER